MPKIAKILIFTLFLHLSFIPYEKDKGSDIKSVVSTKTFANTSESTKQVFEREALSLYSELSFSKTKPSLEVFQYAYAGFLALKESNSLQNSTYLTVIDMSLSSVFERLWVIDMEKKQVVHNTLVAHGRNSGKEFAKIFSNKPQSFMSSLGFYVTGVPYFGRHGLSLTLDGVEHGYNTNALVRAVVMHGADYVSHEFVKKHGYCGRSFGCPSIPSNMKEKIIGKIANQSCLFIYYPDKQYLNKSYLLGVLR